jgi:hypothetical protein
MGQTEYQKSLQFYEEKKTCSSDSKVRLGVAKKVYKQLINFFITSMGRTLG